MGGDIRKVLKVRLTMKDASQVLTCRRNGIVTKKKSKQGVGDSPTTQR